MCALKKKKKKKKKTLSIQPIPKKVDGLRRACTAFQATLFPTDGILSLIGSSVYTPTNGDNWMMAKLNVQITDLGYSQLVEHLDKVSTHLVDMIVIALQLQS